MLENVLRNAATRAAHEISWMRDETVALEAYGREVSAAFPEDGALAEADAEGRVQEFPTAEGATILRSRAPRFHLASAQARAEGSVSSWNFRTRC